MLGEGNVATLAGVEAERIELVRCTLLIAAPAPCVLATQVKGLGSLQLVKRIIAFGDGLLQRSPYIRIFHDFSEVEGYKSNARKELVDWGVRRRGEIRDTNVLFRSKVVALGITLATVLLKDQVVGYSSRPQFEAARRRAILESPGV
ncbi:MAG: hypothetical protein JJ863_02460 [Deltaproteobacteria bacterium]|nr:hypothetical protein [Deltaproteobacteria bacterium]